MATTEFTDVAAYVEWAKSVKATYGAYAAECAEYPGSWIGSAAGDRLTNRIQEAISDDVRLVWGGFPAHALEREIERNKRIAAKRVATRARRKAKGLYDHRRPRDSQRQKVYDAQVVLEGQGRTFSSLNEIQAYADKLVTSTWWQRRWNANPIKVEPGRANASASAYGYGLITMPEWAWTEHIVLHEIAHLATNREHGDGQVSGHGREFTKIFLELVGHKMGKDSKSTLRKAFVAHKVKYRAAPNLTAEQKAAAAERLADVRAA